jgi:hypothetical protein
MKYELKKAGAGEILATSCSLGFSEHFGKFAAIMFLSQIPTLLANFGLQQYVQSILQSGFPTREDVIKLQIFGVLAGFLTFIFYSIGQGAMIKAVSAAYQGEEVSVGSCFSAVMGKLLTIVGANLLIGLAAAGIAVVTIGVGALLTGLLRSPIFMFIGGVLCFWFLIKFMLSVALIVPAIMVEDKHALDSLKRSRQLTVGFLGQIFGTFFLIGLTIGLINAGLQFAMGGQQAMVGYQSPASIVTSWMIGVIGQIVLAVATVVIYFNVRSQKESFGLQDLTKAFD